MEDEEVLLVVVVVESESCMQMSFSRIECSKKVMTFLKPTEPLTSCNVSVFNS